jgi:hypothetical protein
MIDVILPGAVACAEPSTTRRTRRSSPMRRRWSRQCHPSAARSSRRRGWVPDMLRTHPGRRTRPSCPRAAVGRSVDLVSKSIDTEPAGPLPGGVPGAIALPGERRELGGLSARLPDVPWSRTPFSPGESIQDACSPLTGRWSGFDETIVHMASDPGRPTTSRPAAGPFEPGRPLKLTLVRLYLTGVKFRP